MTEEFRERIDRFVRDRLYGYNPTATGEKIIHDPIWGSVVFAPWEVRLIDSPLLQRLRDVNQVGLAQTTYPAARHTRFEHSLGVAAVASRMMEHLRSDAEQRPETAGVVTEEQIRLIRLAALLHDVGHCAYSHLSEAVYGRMPEFVQAREELLCTVPQPANPKPHELFSYFIITSDAMAEFLCQLRYPGAGSPAQARRILQKAANIVIGVVNRDENGTKYSYLTSVINGNFDADKLDYTQRDSYTAGIALTYGAERFLLKLVLCRTEENGVTDFRLALTQDALSTVEELVFNRSMLYHYMYYHQKVLAAEAQMRDAIYALVKAGKILHPCDFLTLTNADLSALFHSDRQPYAAYGALPRRTLHTLWEDLSGRRLMKRALELTPQSFAILELEKQKRKETAERIRNGEDGEEILSEFLSDWQKDTLYPPYVAEYIAFLGKCSMEEYIAERRVIAEKIAAAYREEGRTPDFDAFDLAVAMQPPLKSDLHLTIVDKSGVPVDVADAVRRIERWTETLNLGNWRGYFFVSPHMDRTLAAQVFRRHMEEFQGEVKLAQTPQI